MPRADPDGLRQGLLTGTAVVATTLDASTEVQASPSTSLAGNSDASSAGDVQAWLASHELEPYAAALFDQGYDSMIFLRAVMDSDADELVKKVDMKAGHARVFKAALKKLHPPTTPNAEPTRSGLTASVLGVPPTPSNGHLNAEATANIPQSVIEPVQAVLAGTMAAEAAVHAVTQVTVGQTAWLRIPSGPWINRWVPCGVKKRSPQGGWDVEPHAKHQSSSPTWQLDTRASSWENCQEPSDLQRHLLPGMLAAPEGQPFRTGETVVCTCGNGISVTNSTWFVACIACSYVLCAADREGMDVKVAAYQASRERERSQNEPSPLARLGACLFLFVGIPFYMYCQYCHSSAGRSSC
jgi:hypothetical protein